MIDQNKTVSNWNLLVIFPALLKN